MFFEKEWQTRSNRESDCKDGTVTQNTDVYIIGLRQKPKKDKLSYRIDSARCGWSPQLNQ